MWQVRGELAWFGIGIDSEVDQADTVLSGRLQGKVLLTRSLR